MIRKIFGIDASRQFQEVTKKQLLIGWIVIVPLFILMSNNFGGALLIMLFGEQNKNTCQLVNLIAREGIAFLLLAVMFWPFIKASFKDAWKTKGVPFLTLTVTGYLLYIFFTVASVVLIYVIAAFVAPDFRMATSANQESLNAFAENNRVALWIISVALVPFVEEMIFRVVVFHSFRKISKWLATPVSAFLFGCVHVIPELTSGDWTLMLNIIPYFCAGLVMALIYEKHKNILPCIGVHMLTEIIANLKNM